MRPVRRVPLYLALLAAPLAAEDYAAVRLDGVPHVRQKPDFCGEACAAMWLARLGKSVDQDDVFDLSGLDPLLGRGCYTKELSTALTKIGFDVGPVWHRVRVARLAEDLEARWRDLHADLVAGVPSIVCTYYDDTPETTEHFRLVLGYDPDADEVLYHEPAVDVAAYRRMSRARFLSLWPLRYEEEERLVIRFRLAGAPDRLLDPPPSTSFTAADYAQHVRGLKERIPEDGGFSVVLSPPFVVLGDEPAAMVRRRADNTVAWAVSRLEALYFEKEPDEIIDVWLFKDKESYEKHTESIFGDHPTTPFGYYSSRHQALIMNIATGGGTLVHEIVHPFIRSNFPDCPSWFNEGLASLYEQCGEEDGRIHGYTNWRLAGLQRAIEADRVPTFETLCGTTTNEFYNEDRGTNYAQARYLCYYLQQEGKLVDFYRAFTKDVADDPSGYATLKKILGTDDMAEWQEEWEEWVTELRFR